MHINLYINLYDIKNSIRHDELVNCLEKNISSEIINKIYVFNEGFNFSGIQSDKLVIIPVQHRFKFSDFYNYLECDAINIIANSDISFEKLKISFKKLLIIKGVLIALTRYEYSGDLFRCNEKDSQDTWIFNGKPDFLKICKFYPGLPACDNKLAYEAWRHNYIVVNPSKTFKTIHYHKDLSRSYSEEDRLPKPYLYLKPITFLSAYFKILFNSALIKLIHSDYRFKYES